MWAFYDLNSPYKTTKVQQRYKTFIWRCTCNKSCIQFMICQISLLRAHFCIFNKDHSCSNTCIMIAFFSFWDIQRMNINHSRHTFESIALTHNMHQYLHTFQAISNIYISALSNVSTFSWFVLHAMSVATMIRHLLDVRVSFLYRESKSLL